MVQILNFYNKRKSVYRYDFTTENILKWKLSIKISVYNGDITVLTLLKVKFKKHQSHNNVCFG